MARTGYRWRQEGSNEIGESGVKHLSKAQWPELSLLRLGMDGTTTATNHISEGVFFLTKTLQPIPQLGLGTAPPHTEFNHLHYAPAKTLILCRELKWVCICTRGYMQGEILSPEENSPRSQTSSKRSSESLWRFTLICEVVSCVVCAYSLFYSWMGGL